MHRSMRGLACYLDGVQMNNLLPERISLIPPLPTKHELFAAMAMQALIQMRMIVRPSSIAKDAVVYADALIAELEKKKLEKGKTA